jgi:hypothetical protein
MNALDIFGLQFVLSIAVFSLLAIRLVRPWLNGMPISDALFWLTLPHAFRHIGMVFLVPGVVAPTMPGSFALAAAYGDLAAGILALVTLVAIHLQWRAMIALTWLYTIVGLVDLANALGQVGVVPHFQSAWYIPSFLVPLLLVTHFMVLARLAVRFRKSLKAA